MANRYKQGASFDGVTRFTQAPLSEVEFSRMTADPTWYVPFNGGDIVPVYYSEILPHDTFAVDLDFVVRQLSTSIRPTMGKMQLDVFFYWCPTRVVNDAWKNVQGENTSGYWTAPEVQLAPLMASPEGSTRFPVGSIGDLLGYPNQAPIPNVVLAQCNDTKARIYVSVYNEYFRDQNFMPPIPVSKLNVFQGFALPKGSTFAVDGSPGYMIPAGTPSDGSFPGGSVVKAVFGEGSENSQAIGGLSSLTTFSLLDAPLKACKLHDAFTSVLPSPQKGPDVIFNLGEDIPVEFSLGDTIKSFNSPGKGLKVSNSLGLSGIRPLGVSAGTGDVRLGQSSDSSSDWTISDIDGWNVEAVGKLAEATSLSVNDFRIAVATQQVYELLARGGSRYWSFLKSFFGVEVDNPFPDIPTQIGHIRRDLDLYQVAQTSASMEGGSPQGSLTAFGYTTKGGSMFTKTFLEHGYIMALAVVRHRSVYSTYFAPDNFKRSTLDFYLPQFANIGEQPIRLAVLNPFRADSMEKALGYQEAFWDYRYEPDRIHGILRSGVPGSLDVWHYGNDFDPNFTHVNGEWLISDTQEILDRTLAITSDLAPQFIGMFNWKVTKQRPMPIYSVPGLDTV